MNGGAFMGTLLAQQITPSQHYDYLDGDGTAYVVLPTKTSDAYTVEIDFELLTGWVGGGIFGGYHNWSQNPKYAQCGATGNTLINRSISFYGDISTNKKSQSWSVGSTFVVGRRFRLVYEPNGLGLISDGVTVWSKQEQRDPPTLSTVSLIPMMLYNCAIGTTTGKQTSSAKMRLRQFKIVENGVTKFDFEPRVVDGVAGVGNKLDGTVLFPSSGAFTAGTDES